MRGKWKSLASAVSVLVGITTAAPSIAAECTPLGLITSLDLIELPSGRPGVAMKIAGNPVTMLVDTGGAISAVTAQTVRDLKLGQIQNGRGIKMVDGSVSSTLAQLPLVEIGRFKQENALYYVLPSNDNIAAANEVNGILGGEWLKNYDADFDFRSRKLNLFSQDHCAGKVVYWMPSAVAVLPFQIADNHIRFRMQVDGKSVDAILDTGATDTFFNMPDAQRLFGIKATDPDLVKVGQLAGAYTANIYSRKFKTMTFEGVTINNPELVLMPDFMTSPNRQAPTGSLIHEARSTPAVVLGMSVLSRLHLYIAYKERKVYITADDPSAATVLPPVP
jgi:predicted aspartyl protease